MSTIRLLNWMMAWFLVRSAKSAHTPLTMTLPKNKQAHTTPGLRRLRRLVGQLRGRGRLALFASLVTRQTQITQLPPDKQGSRTHNNENLDKLE
jgi:hypothetical protein